MPRRPLRPAAAAGRRGQELPQGRHEPARRRAPVVHSRAHHRPGLRAHLRCSGALRSGHPGRWRGPLPDRQCQHRPARHPRHHLDRRLRHRALRLVVEQQVLAARLAAFHRAGRQLRACARPFAGRRGAARAVAQSAHHRRAASPLTARSPGTSSAASRPSRSSST